MTTTHSHSNLSFSLKCKTKKMQSISHQFNHLFIRIMPIGIRSAVVKTEQNIRKFTIV